MGIRASFIKRAGLLLSSGDDGGGSSGGGSSQRYVNC